LRISPSFNRLGQRGILLLNIFPKGKRPKTQQCVKRAGKEERRMETEMWKN